MLPYLEKVWYLRPNTCTLSLDTAGCSYLTHPYYYLPLRVKIMTIIGDAVTIMMITRGVTETLEGNDTTCTVITFTLQCTVHGL